LDELVVRLRSWQYLDQEYVSTVATEVEGTVYYKAAEILNIKVPGDWADCWDGTVNLGLIAEFPDPSTYIMGFRLPNPAGIKLQGARVPGYELVFQQTIDDPVKHAMSSTHMCDRIVFINASCLQCEMPKCIWFDGLDVFPVMRVNLGDHKNLQDLQTRVSLPRPVILTHGPAAITDVGHDRNLWFGGRFFGEVRCNRFHPVGYTMQLVGKTTGADILVGELMAPCYVTFQNASRSECTIAGPVMNPRKPGGDPSVVQPPRDTSEQQIFFSIGKKYENAEPRYPVTDIGHARSPPCDSARVRSALPSGRLATTAPTASFMSRL
jgi:hypothetical protein